MQGRHRGPGQQPPGWPGAPAGKDCLVAWAEVQRCLFLTYVHVTQPPACLPQQLLRIIPSLCRLPQVSLGWSQAQLRTCRGAGPQGPPQQYTVS